MKSRKTRTLLVSIFLHALLLVSVFIFQSALFPYLRIGGLVPLLFPVAVAGVALYEGRDVGGLCGLFAGILCDVSFNQPVGVFTVALTVVGIVVGFISDTVLLSGFVSYYISCSVTLLLCAFVQMVPVIARLDGIPLSDILGDIITTTLMQTLYALIWAFPIWFAVRGLGRFAESNTPAGRIGAQ